MDNFNNENTLDPIEKIDRDSLTRFAHAIVGITESPKVAATNLMINTSGPYECNGTMYLNGDLSVHLYRHRIRRFWKSVARKLLRKLGYLPRKDRYFRDAKLISGYILIQEDEQGVFLQFVCNLSKVSGPNGNKLTISDLREAILESKCIVGADQPVPLIAKHTLHLESVSNPETLWMESIYSANPELFNINGRRLQLIWR